MLALLLLPFALSAELRCAELAQMISVGVPEANILEAIPQYERGEASPECLAGLPDSVREAFEARPAPGETPAVPSPQTTGPTYQPIPGVKVRRVWCGMARAAGSIEIEFYPYGYLDQREREAAANELRAPRAVEVTGYVVVTFYSTTIEAANTKYLTAVFRKDGTELSRTQGRDEIADYTQAYQNTVWYGREFFLPPMVAAPYEVHAMDTLGNTRCSAVVEADGSMTKVR